MLIIVDCESCGWFHTMLAELARDSYECPMSGELVTKINVVHNHRAHRSDDSVGGGENE